MAEDWLADVRKYASNADEAVVAAIVRYCGIALRTRDASLVSFADSKETTRVRENYLKKKLALTDDDATLDRAIAAVGERMNADRTKNRVTVYYLLADHFGKLGLFGGASDGEGATAAASAGAAALASGGAAAARPAQAVAPEPLLRTAPAAGSAARAPAAGGMKVAPEGDGFIGFGLAAAGAVVAAILLVMVAGSLAVKKSGPELVASTDLGPPDFSVNTAAAAAPSAMAVAPAAVPAGAGVIAGERDAKPMLTVYFATAKADVAPDFTTTAAPLLGYMKEHPGASIAISGFNDPTGNAAFNAELSKNRAKAVQSALVAAGVDAGRTSLVKPADTTTADVTPEQARRVEVTIVGG